MAQHDMVVDNGSGLAVRTDTNAALQALASTSMGPVEPTVKYAGQLWLDTSVAPNGVLRVRNQANAAWVDAPIGGIQTAFIRQQFITTSGAIALHAETRTFQVEVQGGGAGGGGAVFDGNNPAAAGGGGAGACCSKWIIRPGGGYSPTCAIGASAASATNGNNSTFSDGTSTLTAGGGVAAVTNGANVVLVVPKGGAGGAATGGTINAPGENGGDGLFAGSLVQAYQSAAGGNGASSRFGRGAVGATTTAPPGTVIGILSADAVGYGSGGAGAVAGGGTTGTMGGGIGAPGCLVITEFR